MNMQDLMKILAPKYWLVLLWQILLFTGLSSSTLAATAVTPMKMLVAADFHKSGLRGFNLGRQQSPLLGEGDYQSLAATRANLVRILLPLTKKCKQCTTYEIVPTELAYADQVVTMGEKYGFHVVVTLTPQPAGDSALYWKNALMRKSIQDTWLLVATRYRGRVGVAGYDLINEPVPQGTSNPQNAWRDYSSSLIGAIRQADPEHVIVVEPIDWGHATGMVGWQPLPFSNLVYSFHFYDPYELTHQGVYKNRAVIAYPNADWNKKRLFEMMEPVRSFAARYQVPILVGEFSIVRWAPGSSAQNYLRDLIDLFELEDWPWLYHSYREFPGWDAEMLGSAPRNPADRASLRRSDAPTMQLLQGYMNKN